MDTEIHFECVHRMGGPRSRRPRAIIAKFSRFQDRETIRKLAFERLKGNPFYINEQFPKEIEYKRRLYPVRRVAGDKVRLVVDKLYINDRLYEVGKPDSSSKSEPY